MAKMGDYVNLDDVRRETVTTMAYLLGMDDKYLYPSEAKAAVYDETVLERLRADEKATAMRYLCIVRGKILADYGKITKAKFDGPATESENFASCFDADMLKFLSDRKMDLVYVNSKGFTSININLAYANQYIAENIDGIKELFPDFVKLGNVKFEYIRNLFLMPGGEAGTNGGNIANSKKRQSVLATISAERQKFVGNRSAYPFSTYLNWPKDINSFYGNILLNDQKFYKLLYGANDDIFKGSELVVDARRDAKESFYSFVNAADKVSVFVDCENVDPYALVSMLMNLDKENLNKIGEIVLYDDAHTSESWKYIEDFVGLNVKFTYNLMERVLDNKSLVDTAMATGACTAFYRDGVDSIALASSDSDFWGLIVQLPMTHFYILNERTKTSQAIIDRFKDEGINYTFMDDFAQDKTQSFKDKVLAGILRKYINRFNETRVWEFEDSDELVNQLFYDAYIKGPEEQIAQEKKAFYNNHLKKGFVIKCEEDKKGNTLYKLDLNR